MDRLTIFSNLELRDDEGFIIAESSNDRTLVVVFNQDGGPRGAAVVRRGKFLNNIVFNQDGGPCVAVVRYGNS